MDGTVRSGNLITLTGNATTANTFAITSANGQLITTVNGKSTSFAYDWRISLKVVGGNANDKLTTSNCTLSTTVLGGAGDDSIQTGDGNDSIDGGDGFDSVDAGNGYDSVANVESVAGVEYGSAGNQIFRSGTTVKVVGNASTANAITVTVNASAKTLLVKSNANVATFNLADIAYLSLSGGNAGDTLSVDGAYTSPVSFFGNGGNDTITGGSGADAIYAGDGNDSISCGAGNDYVQAGAGDDSVDGGAGTDIINGEAGNDVVSNGETYYNAEKILGSIRPTTPVTTAPVSTTPTTGTTPSSSDTTTSGSSTTVTGAGIPSVGNEGTPTARFTIPTADTTLIVGQALHVDGLSSTLNGGSITSARFEWNFGDDNSAYNDLVGFNAAHVYDKAGTYTVTLRAINESGKAAEATMTVTVAAEARNTIYVSSAGNDANDGSSANAAIKSWDRAIALLGKRSDVRILFRRGDSFDTGENEIAVFGDNVNVGAYGSGANPIIRYTGALANGQVVISANGTSHNTTIENLTFDSKYNGTDGSENGMPVAVMVNGINVVVRNNTFLNVGYAMNVGTGTTGLLAQGNTSPSATGLRAYFAWIEGKDVVLLGNVVVNSTREHVVRNSGGSHVLIYDNTFTNQDRRAVDATDSAKGTITLQYGSYFYVANNTLNGDTAFGPLGLSGMDPSQRTAYDVFEANLVTGGTLQVKAGSEHVMVRNNILDVDNNQMISVEDYDESFKRGVVDLSILNNTGINNGKTGNFLYIDAPAEGVRVADNLYVAPNLIVGGYGAAPVYVDGSDLSSFTLETNNNWSLPSTYTYALGGFQIVSGLGTGQAVFKTAAVWNALSQVGTDLFVDLTLKGDYTPVGASSVVNGGTAVAGVIVDYNGDYRSASNWTIGAVQA